MVWTYTDMAWSLNMSIVEESFRIYWENSGYWILFVLSLFFILFYTKDMRIKWMFAGYCILVLGVILNPLFALAIDKLQLMDSSTTYVRVYYLLPVTVIIAYAAVEVIELQKKTKYKMVIFLVICLVIGMSGTSYYEKNAYRIPENIYKIPQEDKEIADCILEDNTDEEKARTLVISWDDNWYFIRQYTSRIVNAGSALPAEKYRDEKYTCQGELNPYFEFMKNNGLDFQYVIQPKADGMIEECISGGHVILLETENYIVIKV